jgi:hypothetical protein
MQVIQNKLQHCSHLILQHCADCVTIFSENLKAKSSYGLELSVLRGRIEDFRSVYVHVYLWDSSCWSLNWKGPSLWTRKQYANIFVTGIPEHSINYTSKLGFFLSGCEPETLLPHSIRNTEVNKTAVKIRKERSIQLRKREVSRTHALFIKNCSTVSTSPW